MKTLYLECNMGASGDMLMGALLELIPDREKFLKKLNQAGLPHVKVSANPAVKCGITGTHVSVHVDGAEEESEEVSLQGSGTPPRAYTRPWTSSPCGDEGYYRAD